MNKITHNDKHSSWGIANIQYVEAMIIMVLWIRKQKFKKVKSLGHNHIASVVCWWPRSQKRKKTS